MTVDKNRKIWYNISMMRNNNIDETVTINTIYDRLENPMSSVVIYGNLSDIKSVIVKYKTNKHILSLQDISVIDIPKLMSGSNAVLILTKTEYYNLRWMFRPFKNKIIDASSINNDK